MSLPKNPQPEREKEPPRAVFTREQLKREAARISQQSNRSHQQGTKTAEPKQAVIPELEEIETWATELTEDLQETSEDSKRDERVMLMATAVIKMCRLLKNFSETMTAAMAKSNESQVQNLSIQKQYAESVKESTDKVVQDIYATIETKQNLTLTSLASNAGNMSKLATKKLEAASAKMGEVNMSSMELLSVIKKYIRKMTRLKNFRELMFYVAPIAVIIDVLLRLFGVG